MAKIAAGGVWKAVRVAVNGTVALRLALAALLAIAAAALAAIAPLVLKLLIDDWTAGPRNASGVIATLATYILLLFGGRFLSQCQTYVFATADQRLHSRLAVSQFERLIRLPLKFHLSRHSGSLVQSQTLALQGVRTVLAMGGATLLPAIVQMFIILGVVANLYSPTLVAIVVAATLAYAVAFLWGVRRIFRPTEAAIAGEVAAAGLLFDGVANLETIKNCVAEERVARRYAACISETEETWREYHRRRLGTGVVVAVIFAVSLGAVLWRGTVDLSRGAVSAGDVVLLNIYMLQIIGPLEAVGFALRELAQGVTYLAGWNETLQATEESVAVAKAGVPRMSRAPSVRFSRVSFEYETGQAILDGLDFEIPAGETIAIVGASGAGKSTLFRLLTRHFDPTSGTIFVGGQSVDDMDLRDLRASVAAVTQDTDLFDETLLFNIMFGRPDAKRDDLKRAISIAHLGPVIARLPSGIDTRVGERGAKLSGGERQRVAIARAVLQQAPILFLDEPTSALDADTERGIAEALRKASAGRTTLIVTHRLGLAAQADGILVIDGGRIIEKGTHVDLVQSEGLYARMWRTQMAGDHAL